MKFRAIFLQAFIGLLFSACPVFAVEISISPLGDGRFSVAGAAMKDTGGIHLIIEYDTTILSGPSVLNGSMLSGTSAMITANTKNPGNINVAILNQAGFNGSGQLFAINFSSRKGVGGISKIIFANAIDTKTAPQQIAVSIIPEAQPGSDIKQPDSGGYLTDRQVSPQTSTAASETLTTGTSTTGTFTTTAATPSIGSISLPGDSMQTEPQKKQEQQPSPPPPEQYRQTSQSAPGAEESRQPEVKPKKTGEMKRIGYVSVLDRFKSYKGDRNPLILAELFSKAIDGEITQVPLITAADGTTTVKLKVLLDLKEDDSAPNFAASEAKILSLRSDEATGRWDIELLPAKGAFTASLSILAGSRLMDIPLATVPPAKSLNFSDKEITAFIKDFGAGKPLYDLNNDGKHDYIDDYIYAGNLLIAGKKPVTGK